MNTHTKQVRRSRYTQCICSDFESPSLLVNLNNSWRHIKMFVFCSESSSKYIRIELQLGCCLSDFYYDSGNLILRIHDWHILWHSVRHDKFFRWLSERITEQFWIRKHHKVTSLSMFFLKESRFQIFNSVCHESSVQLCRLISPPAFFSGVYKDYRGETHTHTRDTTKTPQENA